MATEKGVSDELSLTLAWFGKKLGGTVLEEQSLRPALGFLLLWGSFESQTFDEKVKGPVLSRLVDALKDNPFKANEDIINPLFEYFRYRYILSSKRGDKFARLNIENGPKGLFGEESVPVYVERILGNAESNLNDRLNCVFIIIYRFRNNLFHGRKRAVTLNIYKTPFTKINIFLRQYMSLSRIS